MIGELIDYVTACPAVSTLTRGVTANFSGASDLTVTEEPALHILYRYKDGSFLLQRLFRAELYVSHAGDTDAALSNSDLLAELQKYVLQKPYPEIKEGEIISILPIRGGNQSKTGIFEGLMSFKFAVNYKTKGGCALLNISFQNEEGTVCLCGGTNPILQLLWASGMGLPPRKETAYRYADVPGQKVTNITDLPRDIILKGHIYGNLDGLKRALRGLYNPGRLIFETSETVRAISARCIEVSECKLQDDGVYAVEIAFRCDDPYFRDIQPSVCEVYQRKGLLKTPFTLPCKLSERITEGMCQNNGDIPAEPIITVENRTNKPISGFQLRNRTTGKVVVYNGTVDVGETLTVSIPDRTIQNQQGTDCLFYLAPDCYLSEFILPAGENRFVFNAESGLWCRLHFDAGYVQNLL